MACPVIDLINRICGSLSRIPFSVYLLIFVPVVIAGGRAVQELLYFGIRPGFTACSLPFLNYVVTYMLEQICVVAVFAIATGQNYRRFVGVVSVGLLLAWLPPFLDGALLLVGIHQPHQMYIFFQEFSWHFFSGKQLIGESITLWISVLAVALYLAWCSRSVIRTLIGVFLYYVLLQILGFLWPGCVIAITGNLNVESQMYMDLIGLALYGVVYFFLEFKTMFPSILRLGHALPWGLLAAIGARLSGHDWWLVILYGVIFSVVVQMMVYANDYFDSAADSSCGGKARPVTRDNLVFSLFFSGILALHVFWIDADRFYLVATFIALWHSYHLPSIRLKRVLGVSYMMEGLSAVLALLFGMGLKGLKSDSILIFVCVCMAFFGFLIGSIMKDYKDINQDRAAGVNTLYTRLTESRFSLGGIHLVISSLLTVALAIPAVYLFVVGESAGKLVLLGVLALLPQVCLLAIGSKRAAVQSAIWGVNAYLGVLVFILPSEFVRLF
jgi:4-hydroxybenzoate polyprenyltransferase